MERKEQLFSNTKLCRSCDKPLPENYEEDICPRCKEIELFAQVRDYIRSNDVTERDVAAHFNLPLQKVKDWIKDGRIEYKDTGSGAIYESFCEICGTGIHMGNLCASCMRTQNRKKNGFVTGRKSESGSMRFNRD